MSVRRRIAVLLPVIALGCGGPHAASPDQPGAAPTPAGQARASYPATAKRPVVDAYGGSLEITDDYRWLENADDPEVKGWADAESQHARAALDALPSASAIRARLTALMQGESADYAAIRQRRGAVFALKLDPPQEQRMLVSMPSIEAAASAKVLVDPNKIDPTGKTTIDFYVPSPDGKIVAVSLSTGGSERGDLHFYNAATGAELPDVVPHVNGGTAGGSAAFNADGTGVYYTRYPRPGERAQADLDFYQQVYFHELGTPVDRDRYMIGKDFPKIAETKLEASDDGQQILATVENGDGGEFAHYLRTPAKEWKQLTQLSDLVSEAAFARDGRVYMLSRSGAPRGKIVRLPPGATSIAAAEPVVAESEATIESFSITDQRIHVVVQLGGPSEIRLFDLAGHPQGRVAGPAVASVGQLAPLGGEEVLARIQTFVDPPAWYRYGFNGAAVKTSLATTSPADFSDAEAVRETCKSKDGTEVPISILRKKGIKLDGKTPAILTGYGGFGLSQPPRFRASTRIWIEQGGVLAIANLRGGSEFGEAWHKAGSRIHKQNVFDDFAACAQHLIDAGYTRPDKLAIVGGSNGGLLMGAALTQHPELFRAVVSGAGIYDMLRVEETPNGAFNITEYGTVKDPAELQALHAYSPYHHVKDGTAYPAVLFTVGLNDPRVLPWQSWKMAARLQAASAGGAPILVLSSKSAGHGVGSSLSEAIQREVDSYAFIFQALGVPYNPALAKGK